MRSGRHAADDGSFGRSAAGSVIRGAVLIGVAVVVGFVVLAAFDPPATRTVTAEDGGEVAVPEASTTTTTPATTDSTAPAPPAAHDPATVTVLVANASGVPGVAGAITDTVITPNGYQTAAATNADANSATSTLYYQAGYEADAANVAALFNPVPATAVLAEPYPVDDLAGANLVVVVGQDLAATVG